MPSFETCSYYFRPPGAGGAPYAVEFRQRGEERWRRAFAPVTDQPAGIWKGSLFNLTEDTAWEWRVLGAGGREVIGPVEFRTWSSRPPIAKVIDLSRLPTPPGGWVISDQGTPEGWIKYTAPPGWRLMGAGDGRDGPVAAVIFRNARHVVLEGVTIVGGLKHGVLIEDSTAVRILNCDVSGWGRVGVQQFTNTGTRGKYADARGETINYDGGIAIERSAQTVVERCYLHDPRSRANSWMFSHPAGPAAVYVNPGRGGTVLRWNDFVGSDEHRWNDVIEGRGNSATEGGFFRDSDISGNFLAFGNDDGVELEGGGMNVRFFRNKIEGTTCSISTGACMLGPQYIFENLVVNPGDENGLALWFFKNSHGTPQAGQRHFLNNTLVGPVPGAYGSYGKPAASGRIGFMRNNLFVCSDARLPGEWARRDDFDHDLFWAGGSAATAQAFLGVFQQMGQERNGLAREPQFVRPEQGDFRLGAQSPARGRAVAVDNLVAAGENLGALRDDAAEIPFRPLALTAAPRQLNFPAPRQNARAHVTLSVPATAKEAVPFEIRQNRVFTWFTVSPAAGRVAPGETVTLTVTVNAAALSGRPRFKGAFLVRTPSGLSRPVSVYADTEFREALRPAAAPHSAYFEVAALPGQEARAQRTAAPGVSGGRYVRFSGAAAEPEIVARFTLPRTGAYSLLARASVNREVTQRRTFELRLDGAAEPTTIAVNTDYQWNTGETHFRVIYVHALGELAAGEHQLRLRCVSGDLNLNELILTDHPAAFFIDEWQKGRE